MIHVGTSGYSYAHWKGIFYPPGLPTDGWLAFYARVFRTVELNATFYRLPSRESAARWRDEVPKGFVFAAKGSRFLTHMKRLANAEEGLERYLDRIEPLGPKLDVLLWQLPPQMKKADPPRLDAFLALLPRDMRHAFEFRSEAWYVDEVCDVLDRHGAAFCEHDLLPLQPPRLTGDFRYLRRHGFTARFEGRYGKRALAKLAEDLSRADRDVYVYFNNDLRGHALLDALDLLELLGEPARDVLEDEALLHRPR